MTVFSTFGKTVIVEDVPTTIIKAEQGQKKQWSYFSGELVERTWKGDKGVIQQLYERAKTGLDPEGSPYTKGIPESASLDEGRGLATATIQYAEDGLPVYELFANELNVPVHAAPYFLAATAITADEVNQAYRAWELRKSVEQATDEYGWASDGKAITLFNLLSLGTESFYYSTYVLRETKNVSSESDVSASYLGVNSVSALPSGYTANALIGSVPAGEWVKKAPIVRQIAAYRWQIVTEWWWDTTWSSVLYGGSRVP